jgi:peroxiredoxin Q/BCP
MIDVGDRAPDFTAKSSGGSDVRLADTRGQRVVLYFFPKACTTG